MNNNSDDKIIEEIQFDLFNKYKIIINPDIIKSETNYSKTDFSVQINIYKNYFPIRGNPSNSKIL